MPSPSGAHIYGGSPRAAAPGLSLACQVVPWDGYLKYYRPRPDRTEKLRAAYAEELRRRFQGGGGAAAGGGGEGPGEEGAGARGEGLTQRAGKGGGAAGAGAEGGATPAVSEVSAQTQAQG